MVTLQSADKALKSFYLDAIAETLNFKTNPVLAQVQRTSADVTGKDVRKTVRLGVNGGIGAGTETGELPEAKNSEYAQLVTTLKNLYGRIEISDKALRAAANNEGAFVDLLNEEMQSLVKSATFNFGRMLFCDGTGAATFTHGGAGTSVYVDNASGLEAGMYIDFFAPSGDPVPDYQNVKINKVNRSNGELIIDIDGFVDDLSLIDGYRIAVHGSYGNEITGLEAIFGDDEIYGVARDSSLMTPTVVENAGVISENVIQKTIDDVEMTSGSKVNFIICSWGVRRAIMEYYNGLNKSLPTMQIAGGYTALNFNGIPIVVDRFCPRGTMYLLNTEDFKLHQLCDWQWLEAEDGKILKQIPGKPVYTATLVKYAELMCERPCGQAKITGITEK